MVCPRPTAYLGSATSAIKCFRQVHSRTGLAAILPVPCTGKMSGASVTSARAPIPIIKMRQTSESKKMLELEALDLPLYFVNTLICLICTLYDKSFASKCCDLTASFYLHLLFSNSIHPPKILHKPLQVETLIFLCSSTHSNLVSRVRWRIKPPSASQLFYAMAKSPPPATLPLTAATLARIPKCAEQTSQFVTQQAQLSAQHSASLTVKAVPSASNERPRRPSHEDNLVQQGQEGHLETTEAGTSAKPRYRSDHADDHIQREFRPQSSQPPFLLLLTQAFVGRPGGAKATSQTQGCYRLRQELTGGQEGAKTGEGAL